MTTTSPTVSSDQVLRLPAELDLPFANELKGLLSEISNRTDQVALDASEVDRITTPCIQLLIALSVSLNGCGGRLRVTAASEAFQSALKALGFEEVLTNLRDNADGNSVSAP